LHGRWRAQAKDPTDPSFKEPLMTWNHGYNEKKDSHFLEGEKV